jgi:hypothetical protein
MKPMALIHQLTISAKANVRSTLSAQRGRSQNLTGMRWGEAMTQAFPLPVPAQANVRSTLSAQRGRSQNRPLRIPMTARSKRVTARNDALFGASNNPDRRSLDV